MFAAITQSQTLAIEEDEAARLAETFGRVSRWYDIPEVGEKAADHYAFFMAIGMVYGTRIFAAINNKKQKPAPPRMQVSAGPAPISTTPPPVVPNPPAKPINPDAPGAEPPDPRLWSQVDVPGLGKLDIPPLAGGTH